MTTLDLVASTQVIACCSVSLFSINQHIRMPFSPSFHRQTERGDWHRGSGGCEPESTEYVPLFFYCTPPVQILQHENVFLAESVNCHYHCNGKKISISHIGAIMTSMKNNTEDINQFPLFSKAWGKAHLSSSNHVSLWSVLRRGLLQLNR